MKNINKIILLSLIILSTQLNVQAQIGTTNIAAMNNYILNYGASKMSSLGYYEKLGIIEQSNFGITERYKIHEIKRIEVGGKDKTFVVQFFCDESDPCISQTEDKELGKYISGVSYFFTNPSIANAFAQKASDIITKDFKQEVALNLMSQIDETQVVNEPAPKVIVPAKPNDQKQEVKKAEQKEDIDHLSMDAYNISNDGPTAVSSDFIKKVKLIISSYGKDKMEALKGPATERAWAAKLKLPKAKKNYINTFRKENCFVAEFGTSKFIDDLEDKYYDLQDELDSGLSQDWEMIDHAQDDIYADAEDDIYHVEYVNQEQKTAPSITVMIVPDGKRYTLFMRIGSK